jgi:hypothetical protein
MQVPSLEEVLRSSESILSDSLCGTVKISTHRGVDEKLLDMVYAIDHDRFRRELWYDREELREKFGRAGFFCLLVSLNDEPIAYDFGFDDAEEGVYFSDSSATMIERKGVGTVLAVLELVYLYECGYSSVKFTTEELDQAGRPLRLIWEKRGYRTLSSDPLTGVTMMLEITADVVNERIEKYIDGKPA